MHIKLAHVRPHDRKIFLNLRGDPRFDQAAAAVGALVGQRDVNALVDHGRRLSVAMATMPATGATARPAWMCHRLAFREGRGLPLARAACRLQCLRQPLNLTPQAIALSFQLRILIAKPLAFVARPLNLTAQPLQFSLTVFDVLRLVATRHAIVMADSRKKYKSENWITR
jgi:hypothetical protein